MNIRRVSLIIPFTSDGKILLQDRKGISKIGEEWGFFGGGIEDGETVEQALVREVKEELGIDLNEHQYQLMGKDLVKWIDPAGIEWTFYRNFYGVKYEDIFDKMIQMEGDSMDLFIPEEAKKLNLFTPENPQDPALDMIQSFISDYISRRDIASVE